MTFLTHQAPDPPAARRTPTRRGVAPDGERRSVQSRRVLVTGCGRSGTTYVSVLLRRCGVHVPHEHRMGKDGISSWLFGAEAPTVPWGPRPSDYRFDEVVHLVRNPLSAIPSIATFKPSSWAYIERHIDVDPDASALVRSARYWLRWNEMVEGKAGMRVRVEDMPDALRPLCRQIGATVDVGTARSMRRDLNTRRYGRIFASLEDRCLRLGLVPTWAKALLAKAPPSYRDITWTDLETLSPSLAESVQQKALEYGYRYPDHRA